MIDCIDVLPMSFARAAVPMPRAYDAVTFAERDCRAVNDVPAAALSRARHCIDA